MAVVSPTKFSSHGILPSFQAANSGGDEIDIPLEAHTIILLVKFGGDVTFDVVSHATASDTEAGTSPSNETLDGTNGDLVVLEIDLAQDNYLISSSSTIDLDWLGNHTSLSFAAIYRV